MIWSEIKNKALSHADDYSPEYKKRLGFEIYEIERQAASIYWENIISNKQHFDNNPNGLVLPYLLGITNVDPIIDKIQHNIQYHPDFPDIDVDFVGDARPLIRDYVAKKYGEDFVCSVGVWQRYAIKLAMQDVARARGLDVDEVIAINKTLPEDIDNYDLDVVLNSKEFEELMKYYNSGEEQKKVVEMAFRMKKLIKSHGRHAGGFIISKSKISDNIPLNKLKDDWVTEWTEGQSTQLSKFGYVKFDFLGLNTLQYLWATKKLLKEKGIIIDWSAMDFAKNCAGVEIKNGERYEISFDDEKCFELIKDSKLETIFQFDTPLAKRLLKNGVYNFNDILVFNSLGRPGPLPYVDTYVRRRDGKEPLPPEIHPDITDTLKDTLQVIVYQEQLTEIWKKVAGFTAPEAEDARKAVAKKWEDKLKFVKQKWLDGAVNKIDLKTAEDLYHQMETFGRYAFNKCLAADTVLYDPVADDYTEIGEAVFEITKGKQFHMFGYDYKNEQYFKDKVKDIFFTGKKSIWKIFFSNGGYLKCTLDHKFMTTQGQMVPISDIIYDDVGIISTDGTVYVKDIEDLGIQDTYSVEMSGHHHNYTIPFINANSMIISANSHAMAYSLIIFRTLYLKSHYPHEWWSSVLTYCNIKRRPDYIKAMRDEGVNLLTTDINDISMVFTPTHHGVRLGISGIKGVGDFLINKMLEDYKPPYKNFDEFVSVFGHKTMIERLIKLGAFDCFTKNRKALYLWYNYKYKSSKEAKNLINSKVCWPKEAIYKERERLEEEFKKSYPNRKTPKKILDWIPTTPYEDEYVLTEEELNDPNFIKMFSKIEVSYDKLMSLVDNYSQFEILGFQKEYLGFYIDSPLSVYNISGYSIRDAKTNGILECMVDNTHMQQAKNGSSFCILNVSDGVSKARVNVWDREYIENKNTIKEGSVVIMAVSWDEKYNSFSVVPRSTIKQLSKLME